MSHVKRFSKAKVAEALRKCEGHVFRTATMLKVSAQTIYNYIKEYPELKEIQVEEKGKVDDAVENKLRKAAKNGQAWAVCFYLKTQAKDRGYVERSEYRHGGDRDAPPIQIDAKQSLLALDKIPLQEREMILEFLKKAKGESSGNTIPATQAGDTPVPSMETGSPPVPSEGQS